MQNRVNRVARRTLLAALALPLLMVACDTGPTDSITDGEPIEFESNVSLQVTDTAVLVNGVARAKVNRAARAISFYHQTNYEYGGIGEFVSDRVREEQWFSRVMWELDPVQRGDTAVFEFLDLGDVVIAETDTMLKATDIPGIGGNPPYPIEFVNFVVYLGTHYAWALETGGFEILFVESDYLNQLVGGSGVTVESTGSDRVAPFSTTVALDALPAVVGMDNAGALDFQTARPVIDVDDDLGISFDGTIAAEHTYFALFPWFQDVTDPERRRAATLIGQLRADTDRAVIPAQVLQAMLDATGESDVGYVLLVIRYVDTGQVVQTTRLDTDEAIDLPVNLADTEQFFIRVTQ